MKPEPLYLPTVDADTPAEALDVHGMARLLGCSTRHVWQLVKRGALPRPLPLGRLTRWYKPAVLEALAKLHAQAQVEPETATPAGV